MPKLKTIRLGTGLDPTGDIFTSATDRGTAWHMAFRVLTERPDLADRLAAATGLTDAVIDAINAQSSAVRNWLAQEGYDRLHFELPMQEVSADGSETNAIIDCLAEGPEGFMILDHKSGPCPDPSVRFRDYLPQLKAYAAIIARTRPEKPVQGIAINWMNEGALSVSTISIRATV